MCKYINIFQSYISLIYLGSKIFSSKLLFPIYLSPYENFKNCYNSDIEIRILFKYQVYVNMFALNMTSTNKIINAPKRKNFQ